MVIALVSACAAFITAPLPEGLLSYDSIESVRVFDRRGEPLREFRARPDGRALPLAPQDLPLSLERAFLAAEDKGFYGHFGLSPSAWARALVQNVKAGRIVAGGSTVTQQLARALVPRERNLKGKLQEMLWALRLEAHLSKREILAQYLNRVPLGNGATGIEAGASLYFGVSARYVSLAQAAVLASLPKGPSALNPFRSPKRLAQRQAWVLSRLEALGHITASERAEALAAPLDFTAFETSFRAPHFVAWAAKHRRDRTSLFTTLDGDLQTQVEDAVREELGALAERNVSSAAVLVIDNRTSEVLAYVGSGDFFSERGQGQNDGVQMQRQPGSALKPFVYAEAFRKGTTAATVVPDLEAPFGREGGQYAPKNYDRRTHGPVRLREALASSFNIPAVRVAEDVGIDRLLSTLHAAGFESLRESAQHYGLGLALGNGEVSLWELGRAYAGLARGGIVRPLRIFMDEGEGRPHRFAGEQEVALLTDILSDNDARARAFGLDSALRFPFAVAAKTGTSKGYADNWTVGYTRERTVAVWAGNFDSTPMVQVSGISGAGPIFKRVMNLSMKGLSPAPLVPDGALTSQSICPLSGQRAGPLCPSVMTERFVPGTEPAHDCAMHKALRDDLSPALAEKCQRLQASYGRLVDVGVDFYDWVRSQGLADEPWLAASCSVESGPSTSDAIAVLSPSSGDEYLESGDLPLADQAIPVRIRASPSEKALELRLNGRTVLTLAAPFSGRLPVTEGDHHLVLTRPGSLEALAQVRFRVRKETSF